MDAEAFQNILQFVIRFIILIPSIVIHEVAHGYAALWCGDPTAKYAGRLNFNPLKHVDAWGTIAMPLIMLIASGGHFAFGYAKPVPINPYRFRDERKGMLITGIAGPIANLALAIVAGALVRILTIFPYETSGLLQALIFALSFLCQINLWLMFFNLIPIPPLDGSRIIQKFLPNNLRDAYHNLERYGFIIVLLILFVFPWIFSAYYLLTVAPLFRLLTGLSV
ncbi:MAG: site-2 protease family protein [Coriobacteriia bacterium]|nr:site-2 protease family protein [Coriobacteriia bacterium]